MYDHFWPLLVALFFSMVYEKIRLILYLKRNSFLGEYRMEDIVLGLRRTLFKYDGLDKSWQHVFSITL